MASPLAWDTYIVSRFTKTPHRLIQSVHAKGVSRGGIQRQLARESRFIAEIDAGCDIYLRRRDPFQLLGSKPDLRTLQD